MDQQKIIHLVGETVVVGGLFLYLQRQIKSLQNEVSEIKETIIKQQQFIDKNFMAISKTIDFLMAKHKPIQTSSRIPTRLNKQKLNAIPILDQDEQDNQLNELMFPPTTGTNTLRGDSRSESLTLRGDSRSESLTLHDDSLPLDKLRPSIFIQTIKRSQPSELANITIIDDDQKSLNQEDDLDDIEDISEELNQLQSSQESFNPNVDIQQNTEEKQEETIQPSFEVLEITQSNQEISDKKTKSKKVNLKTKK